MKRQNFLLSQVYDLVVEGWKLIREHLILAFIILIVALFACPALSCLSSGVVSKKQDKNSTENRVTTALTASSAANNASVVPTPLSSGTQKLKVEIHVYPEETDEVFCLQFRPNLKLLAVRIIKDGSIVELPPHKLETFRLSMQNLGVLTSNEFLFFDKRSNSSQVAILTSSNSALQGYLMLATKINQACPTLILRVNANGTPANRGQYLWNGEGWKLMVAR